MINPWRKGLNSDGSEVVDTEPMSIPLSHFSGLSADQKLHQMLKRELEKDRAPLEQNLDDYDFDLPDDSVKLHHYAESNPKSKSEIIDVIKLKKSEYKKQTDDEPVVRKPSADTSNRKASKLHNKNKSKAAGEDPTEGATETDE